MPGAVVPFTGVSGEAPAPGSIIPDAYQRIQASPDSFGADVGQALQGPGAQSLDQVGQAAQQAIQLHDKTAADAATNQNMINGRNLLSGDPNVKGDTGYLGLQGSDAMNGYQGAAQKLEDQRQAIAATLNPMQALQFNADSRRYNQMLTMEMGQHNEQQSKVWQAQTAASGIQLHLNEANQDPTNDAAFNAHVGSALALSQQQGTATGLDPQTITDQGNQITSQAWKGRISTIATTDPMAAQAMLTANRGRLDPVAFDQLSNQLAPKLRNANADTVAGGALSDADVAYRMYLQQNPPPASGAAPATVTVPQITAAITGQESGGQGVGTPTSVNGAVGAEQITPGTFSQYAQPGEVIGSAADRKTVQSRIMTDLTQRYPNDPARVAVAYFSGPGNVAPAGSPVPYLADKADGNGKTTSSYVSDVLGRLGTAAGAPQPGQMSKADYFKSNYDAIVSGAGNSYANAHPGDQQGLDLVTSRVRQQMNATITQQEQSYKADNDTVMQAVNGNLSTGQHPRTVDELVSVSPAVATAWSNMQVQQPMAAHEIATKILTENASGGTGDVKTYGAGFGGVFNRIHADPTDPNRITDVTQLYPMVGQPGGITMAGLSKATSELAGKSTVDGEAEALQKKTLFSAAHGELTGSSDLYGIKDPKGEETYLRWMVSADQAIDAGKKAGLSSAQLYSPDSPNYVGKSIPSFKRTLAQRTADIANANNDGGDAPGGATPAPAPAAPGLMTRLFGNVTEPAPDLSSPAAIKAAYQAGKISRGDAMKAMVGKMSLPAAAPAAGVPVASAAPTTLPMAATD